MARFVRYPQIVPWASQSGVQTPGASGRMGLVPGEFAQAAHLNQQLNRGARVLSALNMLPILDWRLLGQTTGTGAITGMANTDTGPLLFRDTSAWRLLGNGVGPELTGIQHSRIFPSYPSAGNGRSLAFTSPAVFNPQYVGIRTQDAQRPLVPVDDMGVLGWDAADVRFTLDNPSGNPLEYYNPNTGELIVLGSNRMWTIDPSSGTQTIFAEQVTPFLADKIQCAHVNFVGDMMVAGLTGGAGDMFVYHRPAGGSWTQLTLTDPIMLAAEPLEIWQSAGRWGILHQRRNGSGDVFTSGIHVTSNLSDWAAIAPVVSQMTGINTSEGAQVGHLLVAMARQDTPVGQLSTVQPGLIVCDLLTLETTILSLSFVNQDSRLWADENGLVITNTFTQDVHAGTFIRPGTGAPVV